MEGPISFQDRKKELEKAFLNVQMKRNEIMELMDGFKNKPATAGVIHIFPSSRLIVCLIAPKSYGFKSKVTTVPTGSFDVSVRGDADSEFGENYDESPGYYIPEKKFTYRDFVKRIIGK